MSLEYFGIMGNATNVNNIYDIEGIEDHLDKVFTFDNYDKEDSVVCYSTKTSPQHSYCIAMISDEPIILGEDILSDLINHKGVCYFVWSSVLGEEILKTWVYVPLKDVNTKGPVKQITLTELETQILGSPQNQYRASFMYEGEKISGIVTSIEGQTIYIEGYSFNKEKTKELIISVSEKVTN